jgi:hypothetical protein
MAHEQELSVVARQRRDALLPELLATVRARHRRAVARRAMVAALLVLAPLAVWCAGGSAPVPVAPVPDAPAPHMPVAVATAAITVENDATVLARCEVRTESRAEWFADDERLRAELRTADRSDGLVVVPGRVFVAAAAIDPFPTDLDSP